MDSNHKDIVLQYGPVGLWRTAAGTADVLGTDDVLFRPDGTGVITTRSVLRGIEEVPFLWAMAEPGRLRVRYQPEPGEDVNDPEEWRTIRMKFAKQRTDLGDGEVLTQDSAMEGFWFLVHPLRWVRPVGDAPPAAAPA